MLLKHIIDIEIESENFDQRESSENCKTIKEHEVAKRGRPRKQKPSDEQKPSQMSQVDRNVCIFPAIERGFVE
jgi:hypothetical protein